MIEPSPAAADTAGSTASPEQLVEAGRAAAGLSKMLELALAQVELTLPQYRALTWIDRGTAAPSTLAGRLDVSRPTVTALVDGLVTRGLIDRRPDEHDRRRVHHALTDSGRAALHRADEAVARHVDAVAGQLPERDARRALTGLALWAIALDRAREAFLEKQ